MTYAGYTSFLRGDEWRDTWSFAGEDGAPRELDEAGSRRMQLAYEALQYGPMTKADLMRRCGVGHWGTEAFLMVMTYQLPIWEDDKGRIGLMGVA